MLYLLESDTRNVKWNGIPLHEATSAIIKEQMNGDFILTVRYPITDSEIYQLFREDMLIKAPAPVIGPQLFRIKKPVENDDHLEITAYHITDDVMQRSINPLSVNKQSCWQALSQLVQVAKSPINDFSFTSDITDRRTINTKEVETLYSVLMDGAHSIVGTWEGELVRDNFSISIKRNRGEDRGVIISTHKNLKSYQRTKNSQNVVTRIHAKSTFKAEGAKEDTTIAITVDSPLIGAYPYINERSYTNNNIQTVEELTKWASAKFTNEHIDKATDAIKIEAYELDGQTVHLGDTVNLKSYKHNVDVYKKAIAYEYDCLANNGQGAYLTITFDDKVKSGGNGGGVSAVANAILDKQETQFDIMLERALANADRAFDTEFAKREKAITDGIELAKSKAEEVKQELSDTINQRFNNFDNGPLKEAKRKAEEALRNAGASSLLAQEAKRIGLDSVAKLEAFKSQATSAQTAFSGDLDALKQTIANDIRPKQAQAESEIAKQVEALIQTKKELAGVKSAQATYEETTTRRLAELTNLANGKASKSELTQTAEELASKIASVKVGGRNHYRDSEKIRTSTRFFPFPLHPYLTQENVGETWTLSFDLKINEGGEIRPLHFYHYQTNRFGLKASADITPSKDWQRFTFTGPVIFPNDDPRYARGEMALYDYGGNNNYSVRRIKFERGTVATDWSPAIEDTDGKISAVESNFRQRADALDAGVRSLTEGLRTKADISSLNVTAENIKQTVKRLETDTQNKLDQKLNLAEFEVQAGSIRQEILNATKDKADKTLVVAEAGKLREEFSKIQVGGRNHYRDSEKVRTSTRFFSFPLHPYLSQENVGETWTLSFDLKINEGGEIRPLHFYHYQTNRFGLKASADITPSKDWQRFTFTGPVIFPNDDSRYSRGEMALYDYGGNNNYSVRRIKFERGTVATDWSPAIEDTDGLITEAKATFERTAQGLRNDLSAIQEYVNKDGQRQEALQRYTREESAKQATAVRELVAKDYVGKATYQEDVKGINQKIEAVKTSANKDIASQIASYRQSVDGKFTDISSQITTYKQDVGGQISGLSNRLTSSEQGTTTQISNLKTQLSANKANADSQFNNVTNQLARKVETTDFQRVKETSQLYERILGNTENGIADKIARMALTNQLFQVEVSKNEGLKTVQRQLAGSWAVQNINSAGDIISGINLGANGHNRFDGKLTHITGETLIDNAVIKSAMIDKLKTANFESGSVTTAILDAEAVTADKVKFDNAFIRKMITNEAFIEQLTSKRIFATKVESVVSSSTFLEAYQGRIGGFTIGRFDQGRGRWISGINQFSVGMGNGEGGSYNGENTAFWANWGYSWNYPGPNAWYVTTSGNMYCRNGADFHGKVDFSDRSTVRFYSKINALQGIWTGDGEINGSGSNPGGGRNAVVWWNQITTGKWRQHAGITTASDRRLKENIEPTLVKALDRIKDLNLVAFDYIKDKSHEEIGLIAQEVLDIVPNAVSEYDGEDSHLTIHYAKFIPYLLRAIQELNQKIEKMEKTIA
ncbi:TPA: tail fiber domain-containing protein [Streptococcus pneumoniae]|nr:tail fiber domain-containing protein [Streptococcus pneumoniae]